MKLIKKLSNFGRDNNKIGKAEETIDDMGTLIADRKRLLAETVQIQLKKIKKNQGAVPCQVIENCSNLFFSQLDNIVKKIVYNELHSVQQNQVYQDARSGMYMVISFMPWTTEQTIQKLSMSSKEKPLGYVYLLTDLIINKRPSADIVHFFHVLLCFGGKILKVHTVIGDYGGVFITWPVDLLNSKERQFIGL